MRAAALVVFVTLALGACAGPSWTREGASASDLESDRAACLEESGNTTGVMNLRTSRFVERCLEERGWRQDGGQAQAAAIEQPVVAVPTADAPEARSPDTAGMSFDECFAKCRELTERTKAQCFDACLR